MTVCGAISIELICFCRYTIDFAVSTLRTSARSPRVVTATNTGESVLEATRAELDAAKVTESVMGQCALILARHIDAGEVNGAGLASLVKAHRETMTAALAAAPAEDDPLTRLRRLRQQPSNPTTGA